MTYYCTTCNGYKDFEPAFKCEVRGHRVILRANPGEADE